MKKVWIFFGFITAVVLVYTVYVYYSLHIVSPSQIILIATGHPNKLIPQRVAYFWVNREDYIKKSVADDANLPFFVLGGRNFPFDQKSDMLYLKIFKKIISIIDDPNLVNPYSHLSLLHETVINKDLELVKLLVDSGARLGCKATLIRDGETVLLTPLELAESLYSKNRDSEYLKIASYLKSKIAD